MKTIQKIKLGNFKRFSSFVTIFDNELNLLIGDNESGKSSILLALDLVLSGSRNKIETHSLESLFNADAIRTFLEGDKKLEELPVMYAELYLNEQNTPELNGRNNSDKVESDGLRLLCEPDMEFSKDIKDILAQEQPNFPFEFYAIKFNTFSGEAYNGYKKHLKHILIDSSLISNEYATREYIKTIYGANVDDREKNRYQNEYRKHKSAFKDNVLNDLNTKVDDYSFTLRTGSKANLEDDLTLTEANIPIENKGKGRQCFIKTEFALRRNHAEQDLDTLLLEEPENHLSHLNMKKLVQRIAASKDKQLFVATHNNLISARLDLRKAIMLNSSSDTPASLSALSKGTAEFFMKAPDNNILEFILSKKVILVEGWASPHL
jgi:predicted ATP-dependent endonuclease of OLD family